MSARIIKERNYVAGWLDSSIHDFLSVMAPRAASTKFALISCLDSNPRPVSILTASPELQPLRDNVQRIGSGLLLPTEILLAADARQQLFFGFDEVLFFRTRDIRPKPASLSLVGPARVTQPRLRSLVAWMSQNSCSLALGGGDGMNFVVRAQGLVRDLLGFSIKQPEGLPAPFTVLASS